MVPYSLSRLVFFRPLNTCLDNPLTASQAQPPFPRRHTAVASRRAIRVQTFGVEEQCNTTGPADADQHDSTYAMHYLRHESMQSFWARPVKGVFLYRRFRRLFLCPVRHRLAPHDFNLGRPTPAVISARRRVCRQPPEPRPSRRTPPGPGEQAHTAGRGRPPSGSRR